MHDGSMPNCSQGANWATTILQRIIVQKPVSKITLLRVISFVCLETKHYQYFILGNINQNWSGVTFRVNKLPHVLSRKRLFGHLVCVFGLTLFPGDQNDQNKSTSIVTPHQSMQFSHKMKNTWVICSNVFCN